MKLTVFNGSPRGKNSNTAILLGHFFEGFTAVEGNSFEVHYLVLEKELDSYLGAFRRAEQALLAFPLYTDCMPAVVKTFIEALEPFCGLEGKPALGFIVHSGFPESIHSRNLERYLERLAGRLGCSYLGTVIKGGTEGIKDQPSSMTRKLFRAFRELGRWFGETGRFDEQIVRKLAGPVRLSGWRIILARLGAWMGNRMYWDRLLKKNGAYEKRFDRPYQPDCDGRSASL